MSNYSRCGKKWSIPEILRLEREHNLLELPIKEIALLHKRSVKAILCKLEEEGIITCWSQANKINLSDFKNGMYDDEGKESVGLVIG
jgi:hypothetical protein